MSTPNRINATLDASAVNLIAKQLTAVSELMPFLVDLTPEERQVLPKMGDKSRALVDRCLEIAQQDESFLPRNLNVAEFAADRALHASLEKVRVRLAKLLELVEDTQMLAGSEAYLTALEVYHAAQRSGRGAGLDGLMDRVSKRFAAKRAADAEPPASV